MEYPKYVEYDGLRFCRDEKTGYYLNSTIRKRLHRYIWEKEVGAIPKGYHIHHINGNKSDNRIDNLSLMTATGHQRVHTAEIQRKEQARKNMEENVRPAAIAWHKSDEGRAWHSKFKTGTKQPRTEKSCIVCGNAFLGTKLQKFCSNACKAKYRRDSGADDIQRVCVVCGRAFLSTRFKDQKYCSKDCAHTAHIGWNKR